MTWHIEKFERRQGYWFMAVGPIKGACWTLPTDGTGNHFWPVTIRKR